jgi:uncharacterized protein (DUF433 family)
LSTDSRSTASTPQELVPVFSFRSTPSLILVHATFSRATRDICIADQTSYHSLMSLLERVTQDLSVMGGKPCLRGLRVTVGTVLGMLAAGKTSEEILELYPYLEADDIRAALEYAAWRTQETELPLS